MAQYWEQGNAARQPQYGETSNLFTPVNYDERLNTTRRRANQPVQQPYQPGQPYDYTPPVYSPPPAAAPAQELPPYMQPQQPVSPLVPGAPYGVNAYQNGPMSYPQAFAQPQPNAYAQPNQNAYVYVQQEPYVRPHQNTYRSTYVQQDVPDMPEETAQQAPEDQLRDAYMPAADPKPLKKIRPEDAEPQRKPSRAGSIIVSALAVLMFVFCVFAIIRIATTVDQDERSLNAAEQTFREENGIELQQAAAMVDLLPRGQTYVPTQPPTATPQAAKPTPKVTFHEAAALAMAPAIEGEETPVDATLAPPPRTKQISYPKNPLCNIHESLTELLKTNADIMGRLVIPGLLDEVVVQRDNTYYLARSYNGMPSDAGAVFIDASCTLRMPPENLLLRGQSAVGGKVFSKLWQYVNGGAAFAASAATAQLTTLYEQESYVLFAVILSDNDPKSPGHFNYAGYPTFATDDDMLAFVQSARARSLYPFSVDVNASDRLLTLATLGAGDQSVVLMYRMARSGENY